MASLLAFAGSNASTSINYQLVQYTTRLVHGHEIQLRNMAQHSLPMYSEDEEKQNGYPNFLLTLKNELQRAAGLILSVNEHNGNPSAYCKNLIDWLSRLELQFLANTQVLLMSTSPGKKGGARSLAVVHKLLPRFGAEIAATFSLPAFYDHFAEGSITDKTLKAEHQSALSAFLATLS